MSTVAPPSRRSLCVVSTRRCANCFASSSVIVSLPANSPGRSSGVSWAKSQVPCRSGRPSAVRGSADRFAAGPAAREARATGWADAETTDTIISASVSRRIIFPSPSRGPRRWSRAAAPECRDEAAAASCENRWPARRRARGPGPCLPRTAAPQSSGPRAIPWR